jgi:hypothetical protein
MLTGKKVNEKTMEDGWMEDEWMEDGWMEIDMSRKRSRSYAYMFTVCRLRVAVRCGGDALRSRGVRSAM